MRPTNAKGALLAALVDPPAWAVCVGCVLLAAAFCWPVLASGASFGINDWDLHLFYLESARRSLVTYGQIPHWTPWYCGGSPLLANPSSTFLDPFFVFPLIFGSVVGAKLELCAHQALGMIGAWLLARRLGARGAASLVAPIVFGLSSVYSLHVATGHTNWFALGFLPWAALFACGAIDAAIEGKGLRALGEALGSGLATALILFAGNAYFFVYQCLFVLLYGVFSAASARPVRGAWRPLAAGVGIAAAILAFSAVKLVPMSEFLASVARYDVRDESGATLSLLWKALAGRDQSLTAHQLPGMQWRWWEYGAYVGLVPLALALLGAVSGRGRAWRWSAIALFFVLFSMGNAGPVWPLLRAIRGFEGLRVPARGIAFVVLAIAVLAALGAGWILQRLGERSRSVVFGSWVVIALLAADFFLVTRRPLEEAFVLPPPEVVEAGADAPFQQVRGRMVFKTRTRYTDQFDHLRRNEGVLNCYERLHLPTAAQAPTTKDGSPNPLYRGEAWVDAGASEIVLDSFSPNRVVAKVPAAKGGTLVLNQNADANWRAAVRGRPEPLVSESGVIKLRLPDDGNPADVVLDYRPAWWGAVVTLLAFLLLATWVALASSRQRQNPG